MLDQLGACCPTCDRELTADRLMLAMTTEGGSRRAYECPCGDVTITVTA